MTKSLESVLSIFRELIVLFMLIVPAFLASRSFYSNCIPEIQTNTSGDKVFWKIVYGTFGFTTSFGTFNLIH